MTDEKENGVVKIQIDVHFHIDVQTHDPRLDGIDLGDRVRKPGVKCGGFAEAMLKHHQEEMNGKGKSMFQRAREQDEAREARKKD